MLAKTPPPAQDASTREPAPPPDMPAVGPLDPPNGASTEPSELRPSGGETAREAPNTT